MKRYPLLFLLLSAAWFCGATALGHPVPDLPVRTVFNDDGSAVIRVEVDPRCFAGDPLNEPYLENARLQTFTSEQKAKLFKSAGKLIRASVGFRMVPRGWILPKFMMSFTTFSNKTLDWDAETPEENSVKCAETPVVITAEWSIDAAAVSGYQIKSTKQADFSVHFINHVRGKEQPLNVLFPGEESYVLDLKSWSESLSAANAAKDAGDGEKSGR